MRFIIPLLDNFISPNGVHVFAQLREDSFFNSSVTLIFTAVIFKATGFTLSYTIQCEIQLRVRKVSEIEVGRILRNDSAEAVFNPCIDRSVE